MSPTAINSNYRISQLLVQSGLVMLLRKHREGEPQFIIDYWMAELERRYADLIGFASI